MGLLAGKCLLGGHERGRGIPLVGSRDGAIGLELGQARVRRGKTGHFRLVLRRKNPIAHSEQLLGSAERPQHVRESAMLLGDGSNVFGSGHEGILGFGSCATSLVFACCQRAP